MTTSHFTGRWTLVTGGASGIGLAIARVVAQQGGDLVLLDLDAARLDAAREQLAGLGIQIRTECADVSQGAQLEELAGRLEQDGVHVRHLVTAAGILQPMRDVAALDPQDHDRVWAVNYHGTYHCCRIWGEPMRRAGEGSIVTVSSITDDLFQRCLHQYTITHAIEDRNVRHRRRAHQCRGPRLHAD